MIAGAVAGTTSLVEEVTRLMRVWGQSIDPFAASLVREGLLDASEDVLMLEAGEVRELLRDPAGARAAEWPRQLARERQREMDIAAGITPPPFLGDPSTLGEPPDNLITRALNNHFGGPPVQSERPGELRGTPASRGVVTGRARVAGLSAVATNASPRPLANPSWVATLNPEAAVSMAAAEMIAACIQSRRVCM